MPRRGNDFSILARCGHPADSQALHIRHSYPGRNEAQVPVARSKAVRVTTPDPLRLPLAIRTSNPSARLVAASSR